MADRSDARPDFRARSRLRLASDAMRMRGAAQAAPRIAPPVSHFVLRSRNIFMLDDRCCVSTSKAKFLSGNNLWTRLGYSAGCANLAETASLLLDPGTPP